MKNMGMSFNVNPRLVGSIAGENPKMYRAFSTGLELHVRIFHKAFMNSKLALTSNYDHITEDGTPPYRLIRAGSAGYSFFLEKLSDGGGQ